MDIKITPFDYIQKVESIRILNIQVNPYENNPLQLDVYLIDSEGYTLSTKYLTMNIEDYNQWDTDDYLIRWVLKKLEMTKLIEQ